MPIRVLALTERSSLIVALTMMVPDWEIDAVASADAVIGAGRHEALIIESATTESGIGTLAALRRAGTDGPAVIVGDVEADDTTLTVDGTGVVILTRPFTIADLRDHIVAMVGTAAEVAPPPPIVTKRDRRLPWRRGGARGADADVTAVAADETTLGTTAEPEREPVDEQPDEAPPITAPGDELPEPLPESELASTAPPEEVEPDPVAVPQPEAAPEAAPEGAPEPVDEPEMELEPEPVEEREPEPEAPTATSAPRFTVDIPDERSRIDPLLLPTSRQDDEDPDAEATVVTLDDLPVVAVDPPAETPAEHPLGVDEPSVAAAPEDEEPEAEALLSRDRDAPADVPFVTLPDTEEETAAVGDALDVTVLMAEVLNAFEPVTAAVWVPDGIRGWTALASLGLRRAESRMQVAADQPLFAAVAENLHGVLLSPADLARGYLGGIPGSWTEDIMAVGVGSRRGCDAVVVVGGVGFVDKDVRRLVSLAAGSAPEAPRRLSRLAGLVRR